MSKDSNHSTESLEKLLKLKRWEEPPPGHLDRLSSRIIAQLEADRVVSRESLWSRVFGFLDLKPVLACAYCAGAMGLLVVGLGMKTELQEATQALQKRPADGLRMTVIAEPAAEARTRAASFSLPDSSRMWRHQGDSNWNNSDSSYPVVRSSLSGMPLQLGAQLLKTNTRSSQTYRSNQLAHPVNFSR